MSNLGVLGISLGFPGGIPIIEEHPKLLLMLYMHCCMGVIFLHSYTCASVFLCQSFFC